MKNNIFRRALPVLFTAFFLFSSFTGVGAYAKTENAGGSDSDIYYCREALRSLPNSEALLFAYDAITNGVEASLESINVYDGENAISSEEIKTVFDAYTRDHAEHFWLGKQYSIASFSGTVKTVTPSYLMSGEKLDAARVAFNNAISELISLITEDMTEYEKELILHDALAARVLYEKTPHAHDAYGALVEGKAVCEGYAEALQCLLHAADVQSLIATGASVNPSTNEKEGHAWNIVRIDGKYYHADLTWNDQGSTLYHAYFNLTEQGIEEDHEITVPAFPLPVCDSSDSNYFIKNGDSLTSYSVDSISQRLIRDDLITSVYITGDVGAFVEWFFENIRDIVGRLGINGSCTYGYQTLGREVILKIDVCLHKNLSFVPAAEVSCTEDGNEAHYVCECGRYFKDEEAKVPVLSPDTLFFTAYGHDFSSSTESEEFLKDTPKDCLSPYTYWHNCSRCGEISSTHYFDGSQNGPHSPGAPATEEAPEICILCGEILTPILHTHVPVSVAEKAPTCTEGGKKAYYTCSCGKSFIDAEAKKQLIIPDNYGNIDPLGHGEIKKNGRCERCGELMEVFNAYTVSVGIGAISIIIILRVLFAIGSKIKKKTR